MIMKIPVVAAADWGTSSFRLWALDNTGNVIGERQNGFGMSTLKPADFEAVLEESLSSLNIGDDIPTIICGMAGAAQGWCEAKYADIPVKLSSLPERATRVPGIQRDVRILPGLAQRAAEQPEVMRGEETILLGALLDSNISGTVCMPGTHSKWVTVESGSVTRFSTAMTGELFGLLANHSTLSHFVQSEKASFGDNPVFESSVQEALKNPGRISRALFSIRAMPLLQGPTVVKDMSARLSGLLIGLELAGMAKGDGNHLTLISDGVLAKNYEHAFQVAGMTCRMLEADKLARKGLIAAANMIWPSLVSLNKELL